MNRGPFYLNILTKLKAFADDDGQNPPGVKFPSGAKSPPGGNFHPHRQPKQSEQLNIHKLSLISLFSTPLNFQKW